MNLSQLEVLVAIVDNGSLTEAAEAVGLTQSAVSHSLNRLESELGVTLLERGRQGIAVTRIGEEIVSHARAMLGQAEVIRQKTARERGLSVGKLRFGCVPSVSPRLLTGIIRNFQHRYPDIDIVMFEGNPAELMEWLETGVVDVATVLTPEQYAASVPLAVDEVKIIVSEAHPLANESFLSLTQLANEQLIAPKAQYDLITRIPSLSHVTVPRLRFEVSAYNTIITMVRENVGISFMPSRLIEADTQGIVSLSFDPPIFVRVFLAVAVPSPATEAFQSESFAWATEQGFWQT
jgi:DNA-binding transcriptional LysR family regulator